MYVLYVFVGQGRNLHFFFVNKNGVHVVRDVHCRWDKPKYLHEITKVANGVLHAEVSRLVGGSRAEITFRTKLTERTKPTNGTKRTTYKSACKNNSYKSYKTYRTWV